MSESNGNSSLMMARMIGNALLSRASLLKGTNDNDKDLNEILGYPEQISLQDYRIMYERNGVAERVNDIYPDECLSVEPEVYDDENEEVTTHFERDWKGIWEDLDLWRYVHRIDSMSGFGRYGVLLLGFDDSTDFTKPAEKGSKLVYVRPFTEEMAPIAQFERSKTSARYGMPTLYNLRLADPQHLGESTMDIPPHETLTVHWSRVIHVAEGLTSNEVFAKPRMRSVFNRLIDIDRLAGGSTEMYWKGALPGWLFNVDPEFAALAGLDETDEGKSVKQEMSAEMELMSKGLKRYMAGLGVEPHSLTTQVVSPDKHILTQARLIALTIGVPFRVFMGSEQGSLASSQDIRTWNKRIRRRQTRYVGPSIIRPLAKRLVELEVVRKPSNGIKIFWPDLDTLSEQDRADVADKQITTVQKYLSGNIERLLTPEIFLNKIMGLPHEEAKIIVKAAKEHEPMLEPDPPPGMEGGVPPKAGGADNNPKGGKQSGGQGPKSPSKDRTRSGSGASRNT